MDSEIDYRRITAVSAARDGATDGREPSNGMMYMGFRRRADVAELADALDLGPNAYWLNFNCLGSDCHRDVTAIEPA
jgi:hypothetical protein